MAPGSAVTLRATPARGQRLVGWTGACSGASGECTVTAAAATTVGAMFAPVSARGVSLTLTEPRIPVRWTESVGRGTLVVAGSVGGRATLRLQLRRAGGPALLAGTIQARGGGFHLRRALPVGVLPGGFVLSLAGRARGRSLPLQLRTIWVPPPPEGVVRRAFAATERGGTPVRRLQRGLRELWATFELAAQPTAAPVTVSWYQGDRLIGTRAKSNRPTIDTGIRAPAGLPAGRYRVELRAGGRLVRRLDVRVR
jgi:hypothetical protein